MNRIYKALDMFYKDKKNPTQRDYGNSSRCYGIS